MFKLIPVLVLMTFIGGACLADNTVGAKSAYQLNLVYFVPNDVKPVARYHERISELMLHVQDFYRKEMLRNGFGNRSFGLAMKSPKLVDIITINGKKSKTSYEYSGGGGNVLAEVEAFFRSQPQKRTSQHSLIIMPSISGDPLKPGGVPFYGMGKYCFALDYKFFEKKYLGKKDEKGYLMTKWLGGLAHELGHGLGLPHNKENTRERKQLGTALMGAGNHTFGLRPTFLTKASCAILNSCEVFSTQEKPFYKQVKLNVKDVKVEFSESVISFHTKFETSIPVSAVNVYVDNTPYGVNKDYDAVAYSFTPENGSVTGAIKLSDLYQTKQNNFQLRFRYIHENGVITTKIHEFNWNKLTNYYHDGKKHLK